MVMSGRFYIDGQWGDALSGRSIDVLDPRTERSIGRIGAAGAEDVDSAVRAARCAFDGFADLPRKDRRDLLGAIVAIYERRLDEIAEVISAEMGAPRTLARAAHAPLGLIHFRTAYEQIEHFRFEREDGRLTLCREPIGVCGLITPWNWPANQIAAKVAPALAVGCTMVLKPSEISPYSAEIIAQIIEEAGVPAGVFNLIQGDGPTAGGALSSHPEVDMVSFTGSTRGGIAVAQAAAPTIKRVHQELGGKSANIVLPDADFPLAIARGVRAVMNNSGQTCSAPTRMLVPADRMEEAKAIAAETAAAIPIGSEDQPGAMGPVVSGAQWTKIQRLIGIGIAEGAALVTGGEGRPEGFDAGYYVRPTIFADVRPDMTIAREEIFGPVLSILAYRDEEEAVAIANDSDYGLAGFVDSQDLDHARRIARRLRVGQVRINHPPMHPLAPFGGYKQSGNGREWGAQAFEEFTEVKAVVTP